MSPLQRLLSKAIVREDGCWEYAAGGFDDGYGGFWWNGGTRRAHIASFQLHGGELEPGQQVLHRCDVKRCVNPAHLYAGTHQDNMNDLRERGLAKGIPKSAEWKDRMTVSMRGNRNGAKSPRSCSLCGQPTPKRSRVVCDDCLPESRRLARAKRDAIKENGHAR